MYYSFSWHFNLKVMKYKNIMWSSNITRGETYILCVSVVKVFDFIQSHISEYILRHLKVNVKS